MDVEKTAGKLKNGDETALEEIAKYYSPIVTTIIYNVFSGNMSVSDIEEIASDVFLTLWENREKVIPERIKGYVCRIAKTKALDRLKKDGKPHRSVLKMNR